ncbi:acyl-CoA dehydrogenase family protein [Candidatus Poriferisocius sp.]|uniref:acyl-CoA dehydrogenase family protein n=1 Tax=Candidatus Poriferisocius sp. TaxID=3101276 RepID=UPI003B5B0C5C
MEFGWESDHLAYRDDVVAFLDEELPSHWHGATAVLGSRENVAYSRRFAGLLAERGWLTPHWPSEYGGEEASPWMLAALGEELWSRGEPRGPQYMNANWIGPSIMAHGTPEQQSRYLPPISAGNVVWCQGFSEPDSGTDLASLRTRAERDGAEYVVNGEKIWTSYGDVAEHCYLLVRTDPQSERHQGISVLLVDMPADGLEVNTIPGVVGEHSFNELVFRDVRVPVENRLGPEHEGWAVVREALSFERVGAPRWARAAFVLNEAIEAALSADRKLDEVALQAIGVAKSACEAARILSYRVIDERARDLPPSPHGNMARAAMVQAERLVAEACLTIDGPETLAYGSRADHQVRKSLAAGVAAGTYEVQLNLISRLHLGLPKG